MSTKKLWKRDKRGGKRENAGRKSNWKNKDTITIRVPRAIISRVIEVAHRIDSGKNIEFDTESNLEEDDFATKSKTIKNEIITQSNLEGQELKSDFVTKSILSYSQAIEIALINSPL